MSGGGCGLRVGGVRTYGHQYTYIVAEAQVALLSMYIYYMCLILSVDCSRPREPFLTQAGQHEPFYK